HGRGGDGREQRRVVLGTDAQQRSPRHRRGGGVARTGPSGGLTPALLGGDGVDLHPPRLPAALQRLEELDVGLHAVRRVIVLVTDEDQRQRRLLAQQPEVAVVGDRRAGIVRLGDQRT